MKRTVAGGFAAALISALAVTSVPTTAHATGHAGSPSVPEQALAREAASRLVAGRPPVLHVSASDHFVADSVTTAERGLQYVAYHRTYKGLPVIGGDFVVTTDARGHVVSTSVAQTSRTSLSSVTPRVSEAAARRTAAAQVRHPSLEKGTRLVVVQDRASHLAWESTVRGARQGEPSRLTVYVDAVTGRVLDTLEHVADGTGTGSYDGPNPLRFGTTKTRTGYAMADPNLNGMPCQDLATGRTFTGSDDVWGNGVATNKETGCVDALFVADTENDMLAAWDRRNGMNGHGGAWPIRIGLHDVNAYYDGIEVLVGHNRAGDWIPALDVLGHEMGHGVDDHTPGGLSGNGTQEFVADTFGAATEWYADEPSRYDSPDFTVGEEVNLVGSGPIRYMYKPSLAGDDNCYTSKTPTEEVHAAAGPGNHWFYLVAEGSHPSNGQPHSPTCNGSSVTGIGIRTAEKIMYNAMLMKTTRSSYLKYRTWTLTAAKNLFPGSCREFDTVKAAWNAVRVPAQSGDPTCKTAG